MAIILQSSRELAYCGRFAGAVYANHQDDKRVWLFRNDQWLRNRCEDIRKHLPQALLQRSYVLEFLSIKAFLQSGYDALCRVDTDISHYQRGFELLEDFCVDIATRRELGQVIGEPAITTVEPGAQALYEARLCCRLFHFRFAKHQLFPLSGVTSHFTPDIGARCGAKKNPETKR
jgi:hypothetical protein